MQEGNAAWAEQMLVGGAHQVVDILGAQWNKGHSMGRVDQGSGAVAFCRFQNGREVRGSPRLRLNKAEGNHADARINSVSQLFKWDGFYGCSRLFDSNKKWEEQRSKFIIWNENVVCTRERC